MGYAKRAAPADAVLLTIDEAQRLLGYGDGTIRTLLRSGELPVVRLGPRSVRIPRTAIEEWIEARMERWDGESLEVGDA